MLSENLKQAIREHKAGNLSEAKKIYSSILRSTPNHPEANHNLGILYTQSSSFEKALPHLKKALELDSSRSQFWVSYIDVLVRSCNFSGAWQILNQGRSIGLSGEAIDKMESDLSVKLSAQQKEMEDITNAFTAGGFYLAEEKAREFINNYKTHVFGWKALGAALVKTGRSQEAVSALEKALSPDDPQSYILMGKALSSLERIQESIEFFHKALKIDPENLDVINSMGIAFNKLGHLGKARQYYLLALERDPDNIEIITNIGALEQTSGNLDQAESYYRQALDINPGLVETLNNLGAVLQLQEKFEEAIECYQSALKHHPGCQPAYDNICQLYEKTNQIDKLKAEEDRHFVIDLPPTIPYPLSVITNPNQRVSR